jgi:hypothetical protein
MAVVLAPLKGYGPQVTEPLGFVRTIVAPSSSVLAIVIVQTAVVVPELTVAVQAA